METMRSISIRRQFLGFIEGKQLVLMTTRDGNRYFQLAIKANLIAEKVCTLLERMYGTKTILYCAFEWNAELQKLYKLDPRIQGIYVPEKEFGKVKDLVNKI